MSPQLTNDFVLCLDKKTDEYHFAINENHESSR